jgi:hypothetical protein
MTANIVLVLVFDSGARTVPGRLLSVGLSVSADFSGLRAKALNQNAEPGPRATVVMATGVVTVKESEPVAVLAGENEPDCGSPPSPARTSDEVIEGPRAVIPLTSTWVRRSIRYEITNT